MSRRRLAPLVAAFALALPASALAHAKLVKSEPGRRATLSAAPRSVRLWFNERLEPSFARLTVVDADGKSVDKGSPQVAADDPKELQVDLGDLAPGTYTVTFEVLSEDGHRVKQSFPFTVKPSRAKESPAAK
jgi:copper resistance protein C